MSWPAACLSKGHSSTTALYFGYVKEDRALARALIGTSMVIVILKCHDVTMTDKLVIFDSLNGVVLGDTWILSEMQKYVQTYPENYYFK